MAGGSRSHGTGQELDGVIRGHIHHAMGRETNGIHYANTGQLG